MIGRLLGHTDVGSTARYAHLARDAEKTAVARVGGSIEADILRVRERQSNNPPLKRPVDPAAADQNGTAYSLLSGLL